MRTAIIAAIALSSLAACTQLGEDDKRALQETRDMAAQAKEAAVRAEESARLASESAAKSADLAARSSDRSDRIFRQGSNK